MLSGRRFLRSAFAVALFGVWTLAMPTRANEPVGKRPVLIVEISTKVSERSVLRKELVTYQAARLKRWLHDGQLANYCVLFARYAQNDSWDAMEVLTFADEASLSKWKAIEQESPAGLRMQALRVATQIVTTQTDQIWHRGNPSSASDPTYLVLPYQVLVGLPEYDAYAKASTQQFDRLMAIGNLDGYEIDFARFPPAHPWKSLILLRYEDDAALGRRDEMMKSVRSALEADQAWSAVMANKASIRTEGEAVVADQLASGGDR